MSQPEDIKAVRRKKRRHVHSFLWWVGHVAMAIPILVLMVLALGYWRLSEGPVSIAPLAQLLEYRANQFSDGQRIRIGGAYLAHGKTSFSARVILKDIAISDSDETTLLRLPQVSSQVEWYSLVKRDPRLYSIRVDGVQIDFIRTAEGGINFSSPLFQDATRNSANGSGNFAKIVSSPLFSKLSGFELHDALLTYYNAETGKYWLADEGSVSIRSQNNALDMKATLSVPSNDGQTGRAEVALTRQLSDDFTDVRIGFENADPQDLASEFEALNWLRVLETRVSGNLGMQISDQGRLTDLAGVLKIGEGRVITPPSDDIVGFDAAKVYFTYNREKDVLSFSELNLVTSYGYFTAEGSAVLSRARDGSVSDILTNLKFSDALLSRPDVFEGPLQFSEGAAEVNVKLAPFHVKVNNVTVRDETSVYSVRGSSFAGALDWIHRYTLTVDTLPKNRLMALWPTIAIPKTRRWVDQNILSGDISRLRGVFWNEGAAPHFTIDFSLDGVESRFMKTMPHIQDGFGGARLTDRFLQIDLSSGHVIAPNGGRINMSGSSLFIEDITVRPAMGDIHLRTRSDLQTALSIMDLPPFEYLKKVNLSPAIATGEVDVTAFMTVPLKKGTKPKEVDFHVEADVKAVESSGLFPGRLLTADTLKFTADNTQVAVKGEALVEGQPTDIDWNMPVVFGQKPHSVLHADLILTDEVLSDFNIVLPEGFFTGETPAHVVLDLAKDQPPRYEISSGLLGSAIALPNLGWRKGTKEAGTLFVAGQFGKNPTVDELRLEAAGLTAKGYVEFDEDGKFASLVLPELKLKRWMDVSARVSPPSAAGTSVALRGGFIDAGRLPGNSKGGGTSNLDIRLDRLKINDGIALTSLRSTAVSNNGLSGRFDALVNGSSPLSGKLTPDKNGTMIAINADDAGQILRDAGIFKATYGGDMALELRPTGDKGDFDFQFAIHKTRLKNSSAMASLLNSISVVGLLQQMQEEGIHFDNITGSGKIRRNGIQIDQLSATGASMGITVHGWYEPNAKTVDFEGVITPIYMINGAFQTILGKLFGREKGEGLFGFTYTVKGDANAPKVAVNPLSILTPGVFREIFRSDPPAPPSQ